MRNGLQQSGLGSVCLHNMMGHNKDCQLKDLEEAQEGILDELFGGIYICNERASSSIVVKGRAWQDSGKWVVRLCDEHFTKMLEHHNPSNFPESEIRFRKNKV